MDHFSHSFDAYPLVCAADRPLSLSY